MALDPELIQTLKLLGAAACGGIVRMFLRPAKTLTSSALLIISCMIVGGFGTHPVLWWLGLGEEFAGAVGAGLGFIGLSIAQAVLGWADRLKHVDGATVIDWLMRRPKP